MNVFVSENPTVRVWQDTVTGKVFLTENNIYPDLKVEVVLAPMYRDAALAAKADSLATGLPFDGVPVDAAIK